MFQNFGLGFKNLITQDVSWTRHRDDRAAVPRFRPTPSLAPPPGWAGGVRPSARCGRWPLQCCTNVEDPLKMLLVQDQQPVGTF
jgi:hypothetical protein